MTRAGDTRRIRIGLLAGGAIAALIFPATAAGRVLPNPSRTPTTFPNSAARPA